MYIHIKPLCVIQIIKLKQVKNKLNGVPLTIHDE